MTTNLAATRAGRRIADIVTSEVSIASAGTTDLGSTPQQSITITGTTTITSFGSSAMTGAIKFVKFAGALTLTHNATSLILPGGANITTVAGDSATVRYEGGGNWRVMHYTSGAAGSASTLGDPGADRMVGWDESSNKLAYFAPSTGLTTSTTNLLIDKASDANVRAAASNKVVTSDLIESASALVSLTDATTIAVDWDSGINFTVTLTTDRILGNPTNEQPGTWRTVYVISDGGPDTLTFDTEYGGAPPTLDDITTTKAYLVMIYCRATSQFLVSAIDASPA